MIVPKSDSTASTSSNKKKKQQIASLSIAMPVHTVPLSCRHLPQERLVVRKAGGLYELDQMHRYEQAAYLCEHRKCDKHFLDRRREGIHHRIRQWSGQHKGHRNT